MIALTPAQAAAVSRIRQDVCVTGPHGSGKTLVLVNRFRMHMEQGLSPLSLLVLAPSEEAAAALRRELGGNGSGEGAGTPAACTVEGFCAALLRRHSVQAGLDPEFRILEPSEAWEELWAAVSGSLSLLCSAHPERMRSLLSGLDTRDAIGQLVSAHWSMRQTATAVREGPPEIHGGIDELFAAAETVVSGRDDSSVSESVREWAHRVLALRGVAPSSEHFRVLNSLPLDTPGASDDPPALISARDAARSALAADFYAPQRILLWRALDAADTAYRRRKQERNALDTLDLCEHAIRLLREDVSLRTRVRTAFDEILLDDFPELNPLQIGVLDLIRRPGRLFATGLDAADPVGAGAEAFARYRKTLEECRAGVDRLSRTFRGSARVPAAIEAIVSGNPLAGGAGDSDPAVEILIARAGDSRAASVLEAESIAGRILRLHGSAVRDAASDTPATLGFDDMAVFVPDESRVRLFEAAFERRNIPFSSQPGAGFWNHREITDLVHLLRSVANPRDEFSLAAVLRSPLAALGNDALYRLADSGNLGSSLCRFDENPGAYNTHDLERLRAFQALLGDLRANSGHLSPDALLILALGASAYERTLTANARANVGVLLAWLRRRHDRNPVPLGTLVEHLEFQRSAALDPSLPSGAAGGVRLRLIGDAGLNGAAVVFVAALDHASPSEPPAVAFAPAYGLVARWVDPDSGGAIADPAYAAFIDQWERERTVRKDDLFSRAITRAGVRLFFSYAEVDEVPRAVPRCVAALAASAAPAAGQKNGIRVTRMTSVVTPDSAVQAFAPRTPERPAGPLEQGQHDSLAGVTSIALFRACPRRFYLARELGWQSGPPASESGRYVDDESIDAGDLGREVRSLIRGESLPHPSEQARRMAAAFRDGEIGLRAAGASRCERDFEFIMPAAGIAVQGRIDIWFEENGQLVLAAFKTDAIESEEAWLRSDEYAVEMRLYALGLRRHVGRLADRALIHFLRPNVIVPISLDEDDLEAALETVREFSRAQDRVSFPLRESAQCFRCGFYRGMCPVRI